MKSKFVAFVLAAGVLFSLAPPAFAARSATISGNPTAIAYFRASVAAMSRVTHLASVSSGVTYLGVQTVGGKVQFNLDYQTVRPSFRNEVPVNVTQYVSASGNVIHWDLTILASPCSPGRLTCPSRVDRLVLLELRGAHYWALESKSLTPAFGSALLPSCWYRSSGTTAGLVTDFSSVGQPLGSLDFNGGAGTLLDFQPLIVQGSQMVVRARETAKGVSGTITTWVDRQTHRWSRAVQTANDSVGATHSLSETVVAHYAIAALRQPAASVCK